MPTSNEDIGWFILHEHRCSKNTDKDTKIQKVRFEWDVFWTISNQYLDEEQEICGINFCPYCGVNLESLKLQSAAETTAPFGEPIGAKSNN